MSSSKRQVALLAILYIGGLQLWSEPMAYSRDSLTPLLQKSCHNHPLPELKQAEPPVLAATKPGESLLNWAREVDSEIPQTTYTLYRRFRTTGERRPYERPYFEKREQLTRATMNAWLGEDDAALERVNDLIWSICEETTWVLPAHERKEPWHIDLFAAETAVELAHVLDLLGDRLPDEIRDRTHAETEHRIFQPYLAHSAEYWWDAGRNNWTGVCAGAIGQTFLLMEPDVSRQAEAVSLVLDQLDRFLQHAFEEDGTCLEGIGYWNYGLIHYVGFAEMLRVRTDGAIDLLGSEKLQHIAQYPANVCIGNHAFAAFADSHEEASVLPFLAARLGERTGRPELLGLIGEPTSWRLTTTLRNVLWWDGHTAPLPPLTPVYLSGSGIARRVGTVAGRPLVVVIKAGHNAEPHNNNDVGSFVLRIGDITYLCDPGAGLYSRDYFGAKRYENVFANSYGHSVPRIGGALQSRGPQARGGMTELGDGALRIEFSSAYDVPGLTEAVRTLRLNEDGTVSLEDSFTSSAPGHDVEEAFVTWQDVAIEDGAAQIRSADGTLTIRSNSGTFDIERLEDACRANKKSGTLSRITLKSPAAPSISALFTFAFEPKN